MPGISAQVQGRAGVQTRHRGRPHLQVGTKYSKPLHAVYLDEKCEDKVIHHGTYGIGVARTLAPP